MNNIVTAQELKTKGISIADSFAEQGLETVVTVRGEAKYVIVPAAAFHRLKEHELAVALHEAERDFEDGKFRDGSVEDHLKRVPDA